MFLVLGSYSWVSPAIDSGGQKLRDVGFAMNGNLVESESRESEFVYVLRKDEQ